MTSSKRDTKRRKGTTSGIKWGKICRRRLAGWRGSSSIWPNPRLRGKVTRVTSMARWRVRRVACEFFWLTWLDSVDDDSPARIIRDDTLLRGGGHKNLYYDAKFGEEHRRRPGFFSGLIEAYVLGLAWVAQYYYQGCPSWSWYVYLLYLLLSLIQNYQVLSLSLCALRLRFCGAYPRHLCWIQSLWAIQAFG